MVRHSGHRRYNCRDMANDDKSVLPVPSAAVTDVVPELTDDQLESVNGGAALGGSDGVVQKRAPKLSTSWLSQEPGGQGLDE